MASAKDTCAAVIQKAQASNRYPLRENFLDAVASRTKAPGAPVQVMVLALTAQPPLLLEQLLAKANCALDERSGEDDIGELYAGLETPSLPAEFVNALGAQDPACAPVIARAMAATRSHWLFMRDEAHWR